VFHLRQLLGIYSRTEKQKIGGFGGDEVKITTITMMQRKKMTVRVVPVPTDRISVRQWSSNKFSSGGASI